MSTILLLGNTIHKYRFSMRYSLSITEDKFVFIHREGLAKNADLILTISVITKHTQILKDISKIYLYNIFQYNFVIYIQIFSLHQLYAFPVNIKATIQLIDLQIIYIVFLH